MRVKLTKDEFELLASGTFVAEELRAKVRDAAFDGRHRVADISDDDADILRDACDDELVRRGFDAEYEPKAGRLLESMIDKFFTG